MKNTRIYDRVPVKDVRVKDPQIGTRTPQILISRKGGEYLRGDVLDANATAELAKSIHVPDIDKINEKLEHTVNKDQIGQPNGVASLDSTGNVPIDQLSNISTDLFIVVSELPTEDIKEGKIYCIRDTSSTAQDNNYIEYAYINNKWEKIGEFKAEPNLSGYAKLNKRNTFTGGNTFNSPTHIQYLNIDHLGLNPASTKFFNLSNNSLVSVNKYMSSNGTVEDAGTPEYFTFTLEDGTKVTKSIRVISTTTSQNVDNNNGGEEGE